ncbi:MAG TPA: BMP family ABC transporter substrate-binding protein, partial [Acidimicrobiia bacterium]|nr:BMP family ABC transporter substrate-binding protein [Acidimicrobiia bacterium]
RALYRRGADVVFAAAGGSGFGLFHVVVEESEAAGRKLWAIGVDNDQWFEVDRDQQAHVLTSVIKRGDVAAYRLVERMLDDEATSAILRLGLSDGAFRYSLQGDGLTPEMIGILDQIVDDIGAGRIDVPVVTTSPTLLLDSDGNEIDGPADSGASGFEPGVDGFDASAPLDPGTYEIAALGTPLTLSFDAGWASPLNILGHTVFTRVDSKYPGDRSVTFVRPHALAEPAEPQAGVATQDFWPLDDIDGWLDNIVAGVVTTDPQRVEIGGRGAVYFEAEVTDRAICGAFGHCVGFIANTVDEWGGVSGWAFVPGFHQRIWWIDQGAEAPLVIIAATPSDDRSFQASADTLLDTLVIDDPEPHPVPFEESGIAR